MVAQLHLHSTECLNGKLVVCKLDHIALPLDYASDLRCFHFKFSNRRKNICQRFKIQHMAAGFFENVSELKANLGQNILYRIVQLRIEQFLKQMLPLDPFLLCKQTHYHQQVRLKGLRQVTLTLKTSSQVG
ncbi:hypothetical protein SDC9_102728 [bioreactor metagenome]|uniref:Uncharacterized protein n=1 Tax=bioreactor metagenome TaxID=1076179 RepID=A0A645AS53_9ZZZZ